MRHPAALSPSPLATIGVMASRESSNSLVSCKSAFFIRLSSFQTWKQRINDACWRTTIPVRRHRYSHGRLKFFYFLLQRLKINCQSSSVIGGHANAMSHKHICFTVALVTLAIPTVRRTWPWGYACIVGISTDLCLSQKSRSKIRKIPCNVRISECWISLISLKNII